jgi:dTDP-glucose 4,6-dehydratase
MEKQLMKNMLVTGGCGFIGSNFIRYLLQESNFSGKVINVDKLTYAGNPENLSGLENEFQDRYTFLKADLCDPDKIAQIFDRYSIDTICHFAAESHVDRSIVEPNAFIQSNIIGTFNLLECCRKNRDQIKLFHHVSTDEVFGSLGKDGLFTETTPYSPNSPYSASKAASDHMVRAYHKTYGLPVTISNCSNNYGPYQFPEKLLPLMILNGLEEKALPVYGDGKNVRDWLYVRDHCSAVWLIMRKGKRGDTYNIGGNNEIENIKIIEMICDILDEIRKPEGIKSRKELIAFVKDRPGHDKRYAIDFSKLRHELDWMPEESFASGLLRTIEWYLYNTNWVNRVKSGEYQSWVESHYR